LQCIAHCEPLTEFFREKLHKADLNKTNPAGLQGRLALSYASLISGLFDERRKYINPSTFKRTLAEFNPEFRGAHQKDALELLSCLTSGIHEDLNRIRRKPYVERDLSFGYNPTQEQLQGWGREAWNAHSLRNDSVIVDLFHGMFKSTTTCGVCRGVAATFDPFSDITVPLPLQKTYIPNTVPRDINYRLQMSLTVVFVPSEGNLCRMLITLPHTATIRDLKKAVGSRMNKDDFLVTA
jgi:ubiquitin carboxyl-terminal hydrolase 4/11